MSPATVPGLSGVGPHHAPWHVRGRVTHTAHVIALLDRMPWGRALIVAAVGAVAAVTAACGSQSATYQVSGVALAGPGCPVVTPGEECPPVPVVAPVVVRSGDREVARVTSDSQGRFTLSLLAGTYSVEIRPDGGGPPTCPITPLTVTDRPVELAIECDSGIR